MKAVYMYTKRAKTRWENREINIQKDDQTLTKYILREHLNQGKLEKIERVQLLQERRGPKASTEKEDIEEI